MAIVDRERRDAITEAVLAGDWMRTHPTPKARRFGMMLSTTKGIGVDPDTGCVGYYDSVLQHVDKDFELAARYTAMMLRKHPRSTDAKVYSDFR